MESRTERVFQCPHCGNRTPHRMLGEQRTDFGGDELPGVIYRLIQFAECRTCSGASLFVSVEDEDNSVVCEWPSMALPTAVPEDIRSIYAQAQRQWARDSNAYAMHIRRALEAMCSDQGHGTAKDSLHRRLGKLQASLPGELQDMPIVLKHLCNKGPHFDGELTPRDLRLIDMFFGALVEYVYCAPYKMRLYTSMLDKASPNK